jgi:hypothetical protein
MKRIAWTSLIAVALLSCAPYSQMGSSTYFGFSVGISNAPSPPRVTFVSADLVAVEPGSDVYVVSDPGADCDLFQYRSQFFMYYGGFWYAAASSEGPFTAIEVHRVPRAVLMTPPNRWHHRPSAFREHDRGNGHDRYR